MGHRLKKGEKFLLLPQQKSVKCDTSLGTSVGGQGCFFQVEAGDSPLRDLRAGLSLRSQEPISSSTMRLCSIYSPFHCAQPFSDVLFTST